MNSTIFKYDVDDLILRYPQLACCKDDILEAFEIIKTSFKHCGKLLIAGNGGSCADCEHIAGELMKGFKSARHVSDNFKTKLCEIDNDAGKKVAEKLQMGLPCIALTNHQGLNTAYINDVEDGGLYVYAQQINVYGNDKDVFLAISTSGNSKNIYNACIVAKAKGLKIVGLSGETGGNLAKIADVCIRVPLKETFKIQELHLPIYHCLCLMLENFFYN